MKLRRSPQMLRVLREFLADEGAWRYGYDLSRATGLKSGTLYPILMRLAENGLLETAWETAAESAGTGRPPRHMYKLTEDGLRSARTQAAEERVAAVGEPAFGGVGL